MLPDQSKRFRWRVRVRYRDGSESIQPTTEDEAYPLYTTLLGDERAVEAFIDRQDLAWRIEVSAAASDETEQSNG